MVNWEILVKLKSKVGAWGMLVEPENKAGAQ